MYINQNILYTILIFYDIIFIVYYITIDSGESMKKQYQKDDPIWRTAFGHTLKKIITLYSIDYHCFCEKYHISDATFRYWMLGKKLPQQQYMAEIKEFLHTKKMDDSTKIKELHHYIAEFMCSHGAEEAYFAFKRRYPLGNIFVGEILEFYRNIAKHKTSLDVHFMTDAVPTGKTQAVIFDFDGTLTKDKLNRTTWESIWINLGYSEKACQELHQKYNRKEISHAEWCKITEEKFKERNLHKEDLEKIASKIHLIKGIRKTFINLSNEGIKIYIVSGSIDIIIKKILGNLTQYIEEIKANHFKFNSAGFLTEIVGTKYDFEGKSYFISQVAEELNISPKDILFVGNSINDRFAYLSGAKTLCINPTLTDPSNSDIWHNCIQTCNNLEEILYYL